MAVQRIALVPSVRLALVLAAAHGAALAGVWFSALPLAWQAGLSLAILASLAFHALRDAALAAPQSIVMLEIREGGRIACLTRRGEWLECEVLGSTYVSPRWTVINLRAARTRRTVLIVPDNANAADFRRLRTVLLWTGGGRPADGEPAP